MFQAGLPVKYEPLNEIYADKYPNPTEPYIGQSKIEAIDKAMEDSILCKVLYYQLDQELLKQLRDNYQLIHLVRSPVQVYISSKIAEHAKRWHSNTEIITIQKIALCTEDFKNFLTKYKYSRDLCAKYSFMEIHYTDIFNWDSFISRFQSYLGIVPIYIQPTIEKSTYNKRDVIVNYKEIMDTYVQFYSRLV